MHFATVALVCIKILVTTLSENLELHKHVWFYDIHLDASMRSTNKLITTESSFFSTQIHLKDVHVLDNENMLYAC